MLAEYEVLEKRFGLERRVTRSKWGKGIGEHCSLSGSYRGYPVSLYSHYHGEGKERTIWTTLAFEAPFAGELEMRIEFPKTSEEARFSPIEDGTDVVWGDGAKLLCSDGDLFEILKTEAVADRLAVFAQKWGQGAVLLSKGFLEYRETGWMDREEQRLRFQQAFLLLGDLADAVSVYVTKKK